MMKPQNVVPATVTPVEPILLVLCVGSRQNEDGVKIKKALSLSVKKVEVLLDKKDLLAEIRREREALESEFALLSETQMGEIALYEQWTPKDLLAHLCFWERRAITLGKELTGGEEPKPLGPGESLDELNVKAYHANQNRPLEEVRSEEQAAYQELIAWVEGTSESDLMDQALLKWMQGTPLSQVVADNTFEHYAEHLPHLKSWMGHR